MAGPRKKVYRKFKTSLNIGFLNVDTLSGQKLHDLSSLFEKETSQTSVPKLDILGLAEVESKKLPELEENGWITSKFSTETKYSAAYRLLHQTQDQASTNNPRPFKDHMAWINFSLL